MAAGRVFTLPGGRSFSFGDPRVKAAVARSPEPMRGLADLSKAYGSIRVPCFHMTGTEDHLANTDAGPGERRKPYDAISLATSTC